MSEITDLLTLVGVLIAVHFVASSLRNLRDALRLVPIGSITPSVVEQYKTVPLCFIGGNTVLTNVVVYLYGRLWIRPKARKQGALCDQVSFLNRDRTRRYRCGTLEPGMLIQVRVSEGENSRHIRRSARRCTFGNELQLAILFPTQDGEQYEESVRCIAVRSRARSARDRPDRVPTRVIEWEVIDPTGIGATADSLLERDRVDLSAFWLISRELFGNEGPVQARTGGVFYSYGSNRRRGFVSWCSTSLIKLLALVIGLRVADAVFSYTDTNLTLSLVLLVVVLVVFYKLIRYVVEQGLPERFKSRAPTVREKARMLGMWPTTVYRELEWHGSTRRSLAVGNRIRRVGFWQQIRFLCWEPVIDWFRRQFGRGDE